MTYIVWVDNGTEGWTPSDELADMDAVLKGIRGAYGHDYVVTKPVDVKLVEASEYEQIRKSMTQGGGMITPGTLGPYARGGAGMGPFDNPVYPVSSDRAKAHQ